MGRKAIDLTGQTFGAWTVLGRAEAKSTKTAMWRARCGCGAVHVLQGGALRRGLTSECKRCRGQRISTHRMSESEEYAIWLGIKQRTTNPNSPNWENYGGRGIRMAPGWRASFERFYADMGARPGAAYSVERIDNEGPYAPGNCRWATRSQQARNTRRNARWAYAGEALTIAEWAERTGVSARTLQMRVSAYGWSVERALTTPTRR